MKKLLLLGALLTIGATSFALDQALNLGTGPNTPGGPAANEVGLHLISRGNVIAPGSGEYMLVINPTSNNVAGGDTLVFEFVDLVPGTTREVDGTFEAKIYKEDGKGNSEEVIFDTALKNAFSTEFRNQVDGSKISAPIVITDVGNLTYSVVNSFPDNTTYEGVITAKMEVNKNATEGTFEHAFADVIVKLGNDVTIGNPATNMP